VPQSRQATQEKDQTVVCGRKLTGTRVPKERNIKSIEVTIKGISPILHWFCHS